MMQEKYRKIYGIGILLFLIALFIVISSIIAGSGKKKAVYQQVPANGNEVAKQQEKEYDTTITGVVTNIDEGLKNITIYNISNELEVTLSYNGGTNVLSKNDSVMSMSEMNVGEIVDAYFISSKSTLTKMQISPDAWEYKNVSRYKVDETNQQIQIGEQLYQYHDQFAMFNGTQEMTFSDLDKQDLIDIKGIGQSAYSVILAKGHGYIRLSGYKDFIGGTIEVGNNIIQKVTKDMVIVAREGSYRLTLEKGKLKGIKYITVARDEQITVDMSEYRAEAKQTVSVDFDITPYGAQLYINDAQTEYEKPIELPYGTYDIRVTARGYADYTGTLVIGKDSKAYEKVSIDLVEAAETAIPSGTNTPSSSKPSASANAGETPEALVSAAPSATDSNAESTPEASVKTDSKHVISIRTPLGAQVYVNGIYKGEVPVSFEKQIGTLSILLTQKGYKTKSYTVQVKDDSQNAVYQFSDMVPVGD